MRQRTAGRTRRWPGDPAIGAGEPSAPIDRAVAGLALSAFVRRRRLRAEGFDRFYRLYVSALIGGLIVYTVLRADPATVSPELDSGVERWGSTILTILIALVWAAALRAGGRGAPLTIEAAEIQHVLLAPIDFGRYLGNHYARLLRSAAVAALLLALLSGEVASRHLPGTRISWMAGAAAVWAALIPLSVVLAVFTNAALHAVQRTRPATAAAAAVITLAVVEVVVDAPVSPSGLVARAALHPRAADPAGWVIWPVGLVLAALALRVVDRVSLPDAERRSRLVAQLRFALAQQDIRSLMLIRRQMASEEPRAEPVIGIGSAGAIARWPILRRNLHSQLRWPAAQFARMGGFVLVTVLAVVVTIGTELWALPLAGVANYLFALETVEPLVQEYDHPLVLALAPRHRSGIIAQHLFGACLPLVTAMVSVAGVVAVVNGASAAMVTVLVAPIAALSATTAAALSIRPLRADGALELPEMTAPKVVIRLGAPPALATIGLLGLSPVGEGLGFDEALRSAVGLTVVSLLIALVAAVWLTQRDDLAERAAGTSTGAPR